MVACRIFEMGIIPYVDSLLEYVSLLVCLDEAG